MKLYSSVSVLSIAVAIAGATHAAADTAIETVVVSAERTALIGTATTSSQGVVGNEELNLLPAYRPAQLLETVPGLVATSHSGEGKANQYLLRGFNLDHGTDLAVFVDEMPINEPTHAHGQGYTDLNFLIPGMSSGIDFTKGPYFPAQGDFAGIGSVHLKLPDHVASQVEATAGPLGYERVFASGEQEIGDGTLIAGGELVHYDGPWTHSDNLRKGNALVRYVGGDRDNGFSVTALYYRGLWNATTDQPIRAITQGLIGRYGTLDPTDGGNAQRFSLSGQYYRDIGDGHLDVNVYAINNQLTLWNNFTHFLNDPVNGDQEAQNERRGTFGGAVSYFQMASFLGFDHDLAAGFGNRYDQNHVFRDNTKARAFLSVAEDDEVRIGDVSAYAQATSHWTPWFRTVLGAREDFIHGSDRGTNAGVAAQSLFQPKGSLIVTASDSLELYASAGEGFHSDDLRGVNQAAALHVAGAPLIAKDLGEEIGLRSNILPNLTATLTLFQIQSQSETTYDADAGQDSAGPGSHRAGIELNTTWQALPWLEFYFSVAASRARYSEVTDDGAGSHLGIHIPNAPSVIASLAAYVKDLGPWSGAAEYRYLGAYPVTPDDQIKGQGYGEWNVDAAYMFDNGWKIGLGIYNVFNSSADAAAFYYADRLPGEPAAGVSDLHAHPIEPRTVRLTLSHVFD